MQLDWLLLVDDIPRSARILACFVRRHHNFAGSLISPRDSQPPANLGKLASFKRTRPFLPTPISHVEGTLQRVSMTDRATSPTANQSRSNSARYTLTESLEQLAAASQKLADLAAKVINIDNHDVAGVDGNTDGTANVERARETLLRVFDAGNIEVMMAQNPWRRPVKLISTPLWTCIR